MKMKIKFSPNFKTFTVHPVHNMLDIKNSHEQYY
jgi:hypothetical protein